MLIRPASRRTRRGLDRPDDDLARAVAEGDIKAFEVLYDRHCRRVFGLAVAIVGRQDLAEEVTQEAFLTLWRSAAAYDPGRASLGTWLLTVTRNIAVDLVRRQGAEHRAVAAAGRREEASRPPDPVAEAAALRVDAEILHRALGTLPPEQRAALRLAFLEGHPHAVAAALAGVPLGTVKSRVRLGLDHLRRTLGVIPC